MISANLTYETINGAWTIGLLFMEVFLIRYLFEVWREVGWHSLIFNRPLPEQFAIAILINDLGNLLVRASTWAWRTIGTDLQIIEWPIAIGVIGGAAIGTLGILCKLRVVSMVRYGHWPWLTAAASMLLFSALWPFLTS